MEGLEQSSIVPPGAGSYVSVRIVADSTGDGVFRMPQSTAGKPISGLHLLGNLGCGNASDELIGVVTAQHRTTSPRTSGLRTEIARHQIDRAQHLARTGCEVIGQDAL